MNPNRTIRLNGEVLRWVYEGKTKDVYEPEGDERRLVFLYKDNLLGHRIGNQIVVDPGGNEVVGTRPGKGRWTCGVACRIFGFLAERGVATHFLEATGPAPDGRETICVARTIRIPLEVIWRNRAAGTWLQRHPEARPLEALGGVLEFTLKSDRLGDPPVEEAEILAEGYATAGEIAEIRRRMPEIHRILENRLKPLGLELVDFKTEFGRDPFCSGRLLLVDEISPDTARFLKDGKILDHREVWTLLCDGGE